MKRTRSESTALRHIYGHKSYHVNKRRAARANKHALRKMRNTWMITVRAVNQFSAEANRVAKMMVKFGRLVGHAAKDE